jgi:protein SCO1/2
LTYAISGTPRATLRFLPAPAMALMAVLALAAPAAAQPGMPSPVQLPGSGVVQPSGVLPGPLREVGYDQRLGEQVPLDLQFRDDAGRNVRLGSYFGSRPVVLVLAYYDCPMLCGVVLTDLTASLKVLKLDAGRDFEVVVASIDPKETPQQAFATKRDALVRYSRMGTEDGWHFLTGSQQAIDGLAKSVGFRYQYDEKTGEFAHAAGLVILTPQGRISRYLLGLEYPPRDVRLGLVESAGGKIGNLVDQVLLYCFHYDPATGRYSAMAMNILRLAAVATVFGLVLLVGLLRRRETHGPKLQGAA